MLVDDVARALARAAEVDGIDGQTFNLVAETDITAREYVETLHQATATWIDVQPRSALRYYAGDLLKYVVKVLVRHPGRRRPSYRDWTARGQYARFDCAKAKRLLGLAAGDRPGDAAPRRRRTAGGGVGEMIVAYLASYYPHGSHSFIRREIAALERLGVTVERFSTRPPTNLVDPADIAEAKHTTALVAAGSLRLLAATVAAAIRHPLRFGSALKTAVRLGRRSERGVLKHLIYLAEACLLVRLMRLRRANHLHAHFGTNAAAIALLARILGGPPYSFTVHGPDEFDRPIADSLGDKIADAAFVVAVSSFGRSQMYRWADPRDWNKIQVVHCGLDATFLGADAVPVPSAPRLVCVGRLAEQKGQLILLQALAQLAVEGVAFEAVLAGDGPMRPRHRNRNHPARAWQIGANHRVAERSRRAPRDRGRPRVGPAELRRGAAGRAYGGAGPRPASREHVCGRHPGTGP